MQSRLTKVGWEFLDLVFPPRCGGCKKWGARWCESCQRSTRVIGSNICPRCGEPNFGESAALCSRCRTLRIYFDGLRSWASFEGPIQKAIHELKYRRNIGLAEVLSTPLVRLIQAMNWMCDGVLAVPLGKDRLKERGYNQAALLARPTAYALALPFMDKALIRVKETKTQVNLNRRERIDNVKQAFHAREPLVGGRRMLVVDDVVTTGATMNACAQALREAGCEAVYGISLARARIVHDR